jgi:hypothetical protein
MNLRIATALLSLAFFAGHLCADEAKPVKTVRLLTVGNSFSHNATHCLGDIAKAAGNTLVLREVNIGGSSFDVHWKKVEQIESDPNDARGLYASKKSLKQELAAGKWDFITIQQASIKSHDLTTYQPFAGKLKDYIKKHAPNAEILMHETWEYRVDDSRFSLKTPKSGEPRTQDEMYQLLASAYRTVAKELGLRLIPVGDAFDAANHDPKWGFHKDTKFDSKKAKPGELPDQTHSLNVGWQWSTKNGKTTLGMDGHHANAAGEYLGACVFYEVLFGDSVVGNKFVPKGVDADYAAFLQETAHKAVQNVLTPLPR